MDRAFSACDRSTPEATAKAAYRASHRSRSPALREAEVGDREGCAGLQATPDLSERAQALLTLDEVQGQHACRGIERTFRRAVDEIRHLYLEYAPQMQPYFILSTHDDEGGILRPERMRTTWLQGFFSMAGISP